MEQQNQDGQIRVEDLLAVIGSKEVSIMLLQKKVAELSQQINSLTQKDEKK